MPNSPVAKMARGAGLLFTGVFTGFLVAVLVLELSLRGFDRHVYTQVRQVELDSLDKLAVVTLLPALITTALLVASTFRRGGRTSWWMLTALTLLVGILALTLVINMPINADQLDWSVQAPPADWASVRDRWQIAHGARTGAAVLAFGALIADATRASRAPHQGTPAAPPHELPAAPEDSPQHRRTGR
ncbi:anthrone oxygenase family protein [Streptomyces sp. SLBN-8D4]|uniref:anthrone oxygenase family protein n=1 Tax=Streptomyces sp. SLBN-8D4 TaxID=3377728 RepID=UPI003C7A1F5A